MMPETVYGLYNDGWQGLIVPEAFSHPAKFSRGLIYWIVKTGIERGWFVAGQTHLIDPFAGVALGGLAAAAYGLAWTGVELEERFVSLGQANIALHEKSWRIMNLPVPRIVQGDSRRLAEILAGVGIGGVVTSPPYQKGLGHGGQGNEIDCAKHLHSRMAKDEYGSTPGQLGAMPEGAPPMGAITSPPYGDSLENAGYDRGPNNEGERGKRKNAGIHYHEYGNTPGQIANLGGITSPPFSQPDTRDRYPVQDGSVSDAMTRAHTVDRQAQTEGNIAAMPIGDFTTIARYDTMSLEVEANADDMGVDSRLLRGRRKHKLARAKTRNHIGPGLSNSDRAEGQAPPAGDIRFPEGRRLYKSDTLSAASGSMAGGPLSDLVSSPEPDGRYRKVPTENRAVPFSEEGEGTRRTPITSDSTAQHPNSECRRGAKPTFLRASMGAGSSSDGVWLSQADTGSTESRPPDESGTPSCQLAVDPSIARTGQEHTRDKQNYGAYQGDGAQLAAEIGDRPEMYWSAVTKVYQQLYDLFPPNGHLCVVLKPFIRRGKLVDLPQMTLDLLLAIGFEPVAWVNAMLVSEGEQRSAWPDEVLHKRKARKSFFRLLYERKFPGNEINAEVVLVVRK